MAGESEGTDTSGITATDVAGGVLAGARRAPTPLKAAADTVELITSDDKGGTAAKIGIQAALIAGGPTAPAVVGAIIVGEQVDKLNKARAVLNTANQEHETRFAANLDSKKHFKAMRNVLEPDVIKDLQARKEGGLTSSGEIDWTHPKAYEAMERKLNEKRAEAEQKFRENDSSWRADWLRVATNDGDSVAAKQDAQSTLTIISSAEKEMEAFKRDEMPKLIAEKRQLEARQAELAMEARALEDYGKLTKGENLSEKGEEVKVELDKLREAKRAELTAKAGGKEVDPKLVEQETYAAFQDHYKASKGDFDRLAARLDNAARDTKLSASSTQYLNQQEDFKRNAAQIQQWKEAGVNIGANVINDIETSGNAEDKAALAKLDAALNKYAKENHLSPEEKTAYREAYAAKAYEQSKTDIGVASNGEVRQLTIAEKLDEQTRKVEFKNSMNTSVVMDDIDLTPSSPAKPQAPDNKPQQPVYVSTEVPLEVAPPPRVTPAQNPAPQRENAPEATLEVAPAPRPKENPEMAQSTPAPQAENAVAESRPGPASEKKLTLKNPKEYHQVLAILNVVANANTGALANPALAGVAAQLLEAVIDYQEKNNIDKQARKTNLIYLEQWKAIEAQQGTLQEHAPTQPMLQPQRQESQNQGLGGMLTALVTALVSGDLSAATAALAPLREPESSAHAQHQPTRTDVHPGLANLGQTTPEGATIKGGSMDKLLANADMAKELAGIGKSMMLAGAAMAGGASLGGGMLGGLAAGTIGGADKGKTAGMNV